MSTIVIGNVPIRNRPNIITNMESCFPAMLILWLGREFYRGKYGMTGSSQAWSLDLGDKSGDLGDKSMIPENATLFSISLLGKKYTRMHEKTPCDVTACRR
ncbi:hypothetical protein AVEN_108497-1 [Araneus ventricosus]|uniref:Uncharacterized protein n=1 Tax=Araneus ventricosus TaxID=182803 RepID=A0A4Y2EDG4_ARAVE|nr:hypothetical protein AVEN_108497-1 [Araneus ventricosus]